MEFATHKWAAIGERLVDQEALFIVAGGGIVGEPRVWAAVGMGDVSAVTTKAHAVVSEVISMASPARRYTHDMRVWRSLLTFSPAWGR